MSPLFPSVEVVGGMVGWVSASVVLIMTCMIYDRLLAFVPFAATGALATLLLSETRGKTLEELSGEDQENFVRGASRVASLALTHVSTEVLIVCGCRTDQAGAGAQDAGACVIASSVSSRIRVSFFHVRLSLVSASSLFVLGWKKETDSIHYTLIPTRPVCTLHARQSPL